MKKMALLIVGLVMVFGNAMAETATAIFKTEKGQKLQVIIDKKVINSEPKPVVKIKGSGGIHQVKIRVYSGRDLYVTKEKLRITPGYRNNFIISIKDRELEVKKTGRTMIYNSRHRRPDRFYNKRHFAILERTGGSIDAENLYAEDKNLTLAHAGEVKMRLKNPFAIYRREGII